MPTVFIRGDYDVTLKQGTVLVKPRVRRKMIRDSVRSMKERRKTLSLMREIQQVEQGEEHRMSVKYMEHLFVSTRSRVTGPALAFLSKAGVPVTFMEDGEVSHEILPSSSHGSPGARIQQVMDPPPLARHKNRAFTKAMFRQLGSLIDRAAPELKDRIIDLREQLIQGEVEPHEVRGIVGKIRDSCVKQVGWVHSSTVMDKVEGRVQLDEEMQEGVTRSSQGHRVDREATAGVEQGTSEMDESLSNKPIREWSAREQPIREQTTREQPIMVQSTEDEPRKEQPTGDSRTDLTARRGKSFEIEEHPPQGKASQEKALQGEALPRIPSSTTTTSGYKDMVRDIIIHLVGDDPPRSRSQVFREAVSILLSVIRYQIILSGLLPLAGGYITTLTEDIYNELAIPIVYIPLLRAKHANGYRKELLRRIDDGQIALRRRILKGAMSYAKHCRETKELTTPALVKIPQELMR